MKIIVGFVLAALASLPVAAAPPDPQMPTGACAGIAKRTTSITYSEGDRFGPRGTHVSFYIDFDNSLAYATAVQETSYGSNDFEVTSLTIADGVPFSVAVSAAVPYALSGSFEITNPETSEVEQISARFIPVNGGTTYLVEIFGNAAQTGVCQRI